MSQGNNSFSQWPKAIVASISVISICTAAVILKEPNTLWAIIGVYWLIGYFE